MHSGKTVVKEFNRWKEVQQEIKREKQLRAFYAYALWETRNGNLKRVVFT